MMTPLTPSRNKRIELPLDEDSPPSFGSMRPPTTPKSQDMNEEVFKKLPFCKKFKVLTRQVCKACSDNKILPICFVGCGVTKLYNILFSTFWLLFIQSFYPNGADSDYKEAKIIYSNVMMVSVVFGVMLVPVCGKIADTCNP